MKISNSFLALLGLSVSAPGISLERLSDSSLSNVQGQSGLTIEQSQLLNIGNLSYTDDGNSLNVEGLRFSSQTDTNASASRTYTLDVSSDGSLRVHTDIAPTSMHIDGIRINNSAASFGDITLNYEAITSFNIRGIATGGLEGDFTTGMSNADMIWNTNGHAMSFDDIGYNASIDSFTLEYDAVDNTKGFTRTGLALGMNNFDFSFSTGALSLAEVSLGELAGELALSANAQVFAGGRSGIEGLTLHSQVNILSDPANYVRFTDDGNDLFMGNFSGALNLTNLTLDVESDHLAIGFDQMDGAFNAGKILIGDSSKPIGSIELDFLLNDDAVNNRHNRLQLYPGIRQPNFNVMPTEIKSYAQNFYSGLTLTSEGLSMASQWNLANAELSYIDDGRRVVISGIQTFGSADTTIDVRDQKIAIGVSDLIGSYSIDGLRVGSKTAPIQGGAELLLSLEVFQAMDFDIDGFTEITAGGVSGGGIRIDGDYFFNNANIGLSIDENGDGIWATGVDYDIHLRDITFDVESDGLRVSRGEQWSTMDITNLRWGNKTAGRSLGRVKLERFEQHSSLAVIPGGAGQVCVGATASTESACGGAGGRWEDRGNQGMTVALTAKLADLSKGSGDSAGAQNRLTRENKREIEAKDSGTQIIFDNYSTNDGLGTADNNEYGLQANLNIDVYETKVLKKTTDGFGNLGDELIYDDAGRTTFTYVASPTESQKALRPLGFAVQGNVSFKELNIGAVQLKHPDVVAPQTVFYGVVMQNLDLTTNLTATPIQ
ncbi:MAG: hypothetical protein HRU08_09170 [Oleispira sp.]|nr:hypothetical protein [Oleispira sp.]